MRTWTSFLTSLLVALAMVVFVSTLAATAGAQAVSDADRAAAKERFARGVEHLRAEDYHSAAAQFEKAYELAPFAVVLYNLGVAYAKSNRPVKASDALQKVIAAPGKLKAERIARAKELLAEQTARIGMVDVVVDQAGAEVRIDGESAGQSPLAAPIRLRAGEHFVEVVKSGFAPFRKTLTLAGGATERVAVTLEATELAFAQIWIRTELPDVQVWLDGTQVGKTPLEQSLPVLPGKHEIELRRLGYHSVIKRLELGAGATAEVKAAPAVDDDAVRAAGGTLSLVADDPESLVLTVDGKRQGVYGGAIALPPGLHDVRVERAGFFPTTLRVFIARGGRLEREVLMDPTPETLAEVQSDETLFTALGITFLGVGALGIGGSIAFTLWNEGSSQAAEDAFFDNGCVGAGGQTCLSLAEAAEDAKATKSNRRPIYAVLYGLSAASLATGIALLVLAPDGDRYAPDADGIELGVAPIVTPDGAYLGVTGRF